MLWLPRMTDRGSATAVSLGIALGLVVLGGVMLTTAQVLPVAQSLQGAADRAALAASDVSRGINGEFPCEEAKEILAAQGFSLGECELENGNARVVASTQFGGLMLSRRSHAGVGKSGQP